MTADGTKPFSLSLPKTVTNSTLECSFRICPVETLIAVCVRMNTNTQRHAGLQHQAKPRPHKVMQTTTLKKEIRKHLTRYKANLPFLSLPSLDHHQLNWKVVAKLQVCRHIIMSRAVSWTLRLRTFCSLKAREEHRGAVGVQCHWITADTWHTARNIYTGLHYVQPD